ncbi:hypothetical protein NO995_09530 [Aestuariibaculum sp. M13]|uniref:hypothetical protein n=1 Tax=Aestuariibaculum sp. M13 TaxID=2967132 RepID=UPI00215A0304|nr:hypothetical protein [Aestuariibaculum sp. M13]MCR8667922.1 hypothetical protein [Aestuariibaculum sp. M13]
MILKFKLSKHIILITLSLLLIVSCKKETSKNNNHIKESNLKSLDENIVNVTTNVMDFIIPDTLLSGWTTFRYNNKSTETHFFILEKLPDGVNLETYKNELVPPFKSAFSALIKNDFEAAMKALEQTPKWWYDVKFYGGVGLLSPKSQAETTLFLDSGTYAMECYIRMPDGMPHAFYGMLKEITVTKEKSNAKIPEADYNIIVSSETGITFQDSLKAGNYHLSVHFKDQKRYETFLGHDVNLVKIENDTLIPILNKWINAGDITSLRSPAPSGLIFLGGVEDLEVGETGFFQVFLDKGHYVLISEIPNALERNMFKAFTVYN